MTKDFALWSAIRDMDNSMDDVLRDLNSRQFSEAELLELGSVLLQMRERLEHMDLVIANQEGRL